MTTLTPTYVKLADAAALTGHASGHALSMWISRYMARHPDVTIRRRWGTVHYSDLLCAQERDAADRSKKTERTDP